jgi:SAM-dependent methyltransferase
MEYFKEYSKYYDLLYKDKDYQKEATYIDALIRLCKKENTNLLDIGCGTGKHANLLVDFGYNVHGIDISETMIEIAKNNYGGKVTFSLGDIRKFNLNNSFDIITSFFHVMSYQTHNDDLDASFRSVYNHLNPGGYFLFDCWYGPGVMNDPPSIRVKRMSDEEIEVIRIAEPDTHYNESVIDVNYHILINNLHTNKLTQFREKHPMRFLFKNEIELFAQKHNFKIVGFYSWLYFEEPTANDWYSVFILEK